MMITLWFGQARGRGGGERRRTSELCCCLVQSRTRDGSKKKKGKEVRFFSFLFFSFRFVSKSRSISKTTKRLFRMLMMLMLLRLLMLLCLVEFEWLASSGFIYESYFWVASWRLPTETGHARHLTKSTQGIFDHFLFYFDLIASFISLCDWTYIVIVDLDRHTHTCNIIVYCSSSYYSN